MIVKANGRSALILTTGLLVCLAAGPSQAAPASADNAAANAKAENAAVAPAAAPVALNKYTKQAARHGKSYAQRKPSKVAEKSAAGKKTTDDAADDSDSPSAPSAIPPSVANANAALASPDTPTDEAAKAMSARANEILQAAPDNPANAQPAALTQVVSADQLNDVDRALHETASPAPALAVASAEPPAAPAPPVAAASNSESSTWDQTSLIGKIFIGFGALLTMASAARMFMA
jgi:hypothetical protein